MLLCLINKYEARNLKDIVFEIDENAFLFSTSVTEAYGNGFEKQVKYKSKKNINKQRLNETKENNIEITNETKTESLNENNIENKTKKTENLTENDVKRAKKENTKIEKSKP